MIMRSVVVFFFALLLTVGTLRAQDPLSVQFELSESTDRIRIDFSMKNVSASLQRVDWFFERCDPWIFIQGVQPNLLNHELGCNLDDSYAYIILPAGDSVSAFIDLNKNI